MRISDWSSDVCSSDLRAEVECSTAGCITLDPPFEGFAILHFLWLQHVCLPSDTVGRPIRRRVGFRSEEHTSELQSLMRISYAVFCLKKKPALLTLLDSDSGSLLTRHTPTEYETRGPLR